MTGLLKSMGGTRDAVGVACLAVTGLLYAAGVTGVPTRAGLEVGGIESGAHAALMPTPDSSHTSTIDAPEGAPCESPRPSRGVFLHEDKG